MRVCLPFLMLLLAGCPVYRPYGDDFTAADYRASRRKAEAPHDIALHSNPRVGQYWDRQYETHGYPNERQSWSERRCVTREVDGHFVIEMQEHRPDFNCTGEDVYWVTAVLVDQPGEQARVLRAWVGEKGGRPTEIHVQPKHIEEETRHTHLLWHSAFDQTFDGYELSGTEKVLGPHEDGPRTTWIRKAGNGWFDGIADYEFSFIDYGNEYHLQAIGRDGATWLNWEGVDTRPDYLLDEEKKVVRRTQ